jgi:hypothetical protein
VFPYNESMTSSLTRISARRVSILLAAVGALVLSMTMLLPIGSGATTSAGNASTSASGNQNGGGPDGLGLQPGKIKHVFLIILENKSYDATFTGLNNNTYLWKSLPAQGVLLKHYYGTGHFSEDNYISMVSGQATEPDTQADCPQYDAFGGSLDTTGSLGTNPDYGQFVSAQGPNAPRDRTAAFTPTPCPRCSTSWTRRG